MLPFGPGSGSVTSFHYVIFPRDLAEHPLSMYSLPLTFHNTASHSVSIPFQMELVAGFSSGNVLLPDEPPLPGFCLSLGEIAGIPLPPHLNLSGFLNWPPSDAVFPRRRLNNGGQRQLRLFPDLPAETADEELRKLSGDGHHSGFGIPRQEMTRVGDDQR